MKAFITTIVLLFICSFNTSAQSNTALYDTDMLPPQFHAERRTAFRAKLPEKSIAFIFANPKRLRNNDVDFQYSQNPNLYYLTGYLEPNAVLVITKDSIQVDSIKSNEFFYVQNRDPRAEIWTGKRLGTEGVVKDLKINTVRLGKDFKNFNINIWRMEKVLATLPIGAVEDPWEEGDLYELLEVFKSKTAYKTIDTEGFEKIMSDLREIKKPEEMVLLQKAIDISCKGHIEVMKYMHPNITEYQAQAVMEHLFKYNGSEYCGYPSICGGAENACTLHYVTNRRKLLDGDMYLTDCGAEYHGYTADVTRTFPVNGKFTREQKIIYELVLEAQEAGIKACVPNQPYRNIQRACDSVTIKGLLRLGIIKDSATFKVFSVHGVAHFLGLDVHDPGSYRENMKAGQVTTVEPGIYIPANSACDKKWWNIGIRIEDDVLITEAGNKVLSIAAPRTVEAIEKLMADNSFFNTMAVVEEQPSDKIYAEANTLSNRSILKIDKAETPKGNTTQGTVVLDVCVNAKGEVVTAAFKPNGSTTQNDELIATAIKSAKKYKFAESNLIEQCGTIKFNFKYQ